MRLQLFLPPLVLMMASGPLAAAQRARAGNLPLAEGWTLQSSAPVQDPGPVIASDRLDPAGWYKVTVPTTVVAGPVASSVYPDPYFRDLRVSSRTSRQGADALTSVTLSNPSPHLAFFVRLRVNRSAGAAR